ncbi:MAG TPA: Fic family protein [Allosphingosinicella sp.]|nr:Fic family protein [Allosphingosinicella sp.]
MTARLIDSPQLPRDRVLAYSGLLKFPTIEPLSPLAVQSKAMEAQLRSARPSSRASLDRLCAALDRPDWEAAYSYPGLSDELEPYVQAAEDCHAVPAGRKAATEFAVYARLAVRHVPLAAMDDEAFTRFLMAVHRRLGAGRNALRDGPVGLRPDAAGNRVLFPDHRLCPALLSSLNGFLHAHLAAYPALCASVAYAGIVYAHPFNDGNGRTARTICNLILAGSAATRHFLPIQAIAARHPAFGIKLRRAIHGGDWLSLQTYFTEATRLSRALQAGSNEKDPTYAQKKGEDNAAFK